MDQTSSSQYITYQQIRQIFIRGRWPIISGRDVTKLKKKEKERKQKKC